MTADKSRFFVEDKPNPVALPRLAYSPREVALALGIHLNTVYKLLRNGQIPHVRIGGRCFVSRWALEALLEARK